MQRRTKGVALARAPGRGLAHNVALLSGMVAKERTNATSEILYYGNGLAVLAATVTRAAVLTFLVIQGTFVPCVATVAAIHQETRSRQWKEFSAVLSMAISCTGGPSDFQDIEEQAL